MALVGCAVPALVSAQDCAALVSNVAAYLKAGGFNRVDAIVTTNQTDRFFASVTLVGGLADQGDKLSSSGDQYFSDRTYVSNLTNLNAPFSPQRTDKLGLRIYKASPVKIELVLLSWNDGVMSATPTCDGTTMFGAFSGGDVAYTVTLKKSKSIP
jgi:hypothetical protein